MTKFARRDYTLELVTPAFLGEGNWDQGDKERVRGESGCQVTVGEIVDRPEPATSGAISASEEKPGATAIATRGVRVSKVQRESRGCRHTSADE